MSSYDIPRTTPGGDVPLPTTNENNIDTLNKKTMILSRWANAHRLFDDDRSESDSDNENIPDNEDGSADGPDSSNRTENLEENGEREMIKGRASLKLYMLTMVVSISSFVVGFDMVALSSILVSLRKHFLLTKELEQLVLASAVGTAILGAILGGRANEFVGRKPIIITANVFTILGSLFGAAAKNTFTLILGRLTLGVGIGLSSVTVPLFIAEHAPANHRGKMVTWYYSFWAGGQLLATILYAAIRTKEESWRLMLGLVSLISGLQLFGNVLTSESPHWLVRQGRIDDSKQVLTLLRGDEDADKIIRDINGAISESTGLIGNKPLSWYGVIKRVCLTRAVRMAVFVGALLQIFQQLSGIAAFLFLDIIIIKMIGVYDDHSAYWLRVLPASFLFLCTFLAVYSVDKIGRKFLLLASLGGTTFSLFMIGLGLSRGWTNSPGVSGDGIGIHNICGTHSDCNHCIRDEQCGFCHISHNFETVHGSCLPVATYGSVIDPLYSEFGRCRDAENSHIEWAYDYCPSSVAGLALIGLVFYVAPFAIGLGPLPWTINAEFYQLWARSFGNSVSTSCHWIFHLIVILTTPILSDKITYHGLIFIFMGFTFLGIIFVSYTLPETVGTELHAAETLFETPLNIPPTNPSGSATMTPSTNPPPPQYGVSDRVVHLQQISMDIPPYRDYKLKGTEHVNEAFDESEI